MKLSIIPSGPLSFDGKNYLYSKVEGLYIDALARYFEEVIICAYAFHKGNIDYESSSHYRFKSSNVKFVELPHWSDVNTGIFSKLIQMAKVSKTIFLNIRNWDLLYLFMPGFPSAITYLVNKLFHKRYLLYLASDWQEEAALLFPWKDPTRRLLYPIFHWFTGWIERKAVKGALLVLTAGGSTCQKYKDYNIPIYETIPRINWPEIKIYKRDDTCLLKPVKLLFVGYLIPRKGPQYLLEAVSILEEKKKYELHLTFVGSGEQREELENSVKRLNIIDKAKFLGYIPNGDSLMKIYRESDIFILPTPWGEGFPRVLYEAMSQSIPIVTTNVSGIPYKMKHQENAILVPPRSSEAIADAVERLIRDGNLRRKLIKNGQKFMQTMLENYKDNQVHVLLMKHFPCYRHWREQSRASSTTTTTT